VSTEDFPEFNNERFPKERCGDDKPKWYSVWVNGDEDIFNSIKNSYCDDVRDGKDKNSDGTYKIFVAAFLSQSKADEFVKFMQ